jgi:hypothetical protein
LLQDYPFYVQFTLNAYGRDLEPGIPSKQDVCIPVFQALSRKIGSERVVWRYDPVILTGQYTIPYHIHFFEKLAERLAGYTDTCVLSFVDDYRHLHGVQPRICPLSEAQILQLAEAFGEIALRFGLRLETCAESVDLSQFGIHHGHCIDKRRLETILGQPLSLSPDKNQRPSCGCMESVDIGMYDSCTNGCVYCYANHAAARLKHNLQLHDPQSPLLYGTVGPEDRITDRVMKSCRSGQLQIF